MKNNNLEFFVRHFCNFCNFVAHHILKRTIDRIIFKYDPTDGTVIAFLPDEAAPPGLIATYTHVGQSSYASWDFYQSCKTAKPEQYMELMRELIDLGYVTNPKVLKRHPHDAKGHDAFEKYR